MASAVLSAGNHDQFLQDGYIFLRGAIPPEVVAGAVQALEKAGSGDRDGSAREQCQSFISETLLTAVNELHGPRYPVMREQVEPTYIPRKLTPDALHHPNPHVDLIHPTFVPDLWAVGAFVFLSNVESLGGAFLYGPGSPNRLRAWMSVYSGESAWSATKSEARAGTVKECLARAGDVILFQHTMLHSGSENIRGEPTRHALRFSFPLVPRLDLADRSFAEMSTVEKANSVRYLRERFGDAFHVWEVEGCDADLSSGFGPVNTHDTLRFAGRLHRFWTSPDDPSSIKRACTADFDSWEVFPDLSLVDEEIVSLHLEHRFNPTLTLVCRNRNGSFCSRLYESADLSGWRQMAGAPEWVLSRPHFLIEHPNGPFMSKRAAGSVLYFVTDEEPSSVRWRSGGNRCEMSSWLDAGIAHAAPQGRITDVWCLPGRAMFSHVLVVDLDGVSHFTESYFQDEFERPLRPFDLDSGPPSQLRCVERAQAYWLVTYKKDGRVFWGEVDWNAASGRIREFSSAAELRRGLQVVGLT